MKSLRKAGKQQIIILTLILTVIFALMNGVLYIINQSYLSQKIEEENQAFLELTTHLMNENDVDVALEYIEHYTHIHDVEIEITNDNDIMLFSSQPSYRFTKEYQINTLQGQFTIFMDNTQSTTVILSEDNFLYINVTLFLIYVIAVSGTIVLNRKNKNRINNDVNKMLDLIEEEISHHQQFHFQEFLTIHTKVSKYLEYIDLLKEQKEIQMKGIAHDIKTPLTLLYNYVSHTNISRQEQKENALDAAKTINESINNLITENYHSTMQSIALDKVIKDKVLSYQDVLSSKNLNVVFHLEPTTIMWSKHDVSRIIENIISNAYHYSSASSTIVIDLKTAETTTLQIRSTPKSINNIDTDRIFEKGYSTTLKAEKGYGLYICKVLLIPIDATIKASIEENQFVITITL